MNVNPSKDEARAVEALYARHEARRREGDPFKAQAATEAQRAILETLEALEVEHVELLDYSEGGFDGFRLRVYAAGE